MPAQRHLSLLTLNTIKTMEWYLKALRQYSDFDGRARRMEYWMFTLFNWLISVPLLMVDMLVFESSFGLNTLYSLAVLIPGIAVSVRRLHDVGKSGWMLLIALIPIIGAIWLFVLYLSDSDLGENEYGPSPKYDPTGADKVSGMDDLVG
jgi:uncharacterized membrane protein YhaH (DUF805 family)